MSKREMHCPHKDKISDCPDCMTQLNAMNPKSKQQLRERLTQFCLGDGSFFNDTELDELMQAFESFHTGEVERAIDASSIETIKAEHAALYDLLPTGDVDAWNLIKAIQAHMEHLENVIKTLQSIESDKS